MGDLPVTDSAPGGAGGFSRSAKGTLEVLGLVCGIFGAAPIWLIVGVEVYGNLTNPTASVIAFALGLYICVPCLALAACSLFAGFRIAWRNSRAQTSLKDSLAPIMLGFMIIGGVIGMFVAGSFGPTIGVGPGG
jgi:hypothetical protein